MSVLIPIYVFVALNWLISFGCGGTQYLYPRGAFHRVVLCFFMKLMYEVMFVPYLLPVFSLVIQFCQSQFCCCQLTSYKYMLCCD